MIRVEGVRLAFRYAAGAAASRFLVALRDEGKILGSTCPSCRRVLCPARSFCPRCGTDTADLVEVGPKGILLSWTELEGRGAYGLVRLDGADDAILHRILGPGPFEPGMALRARLMEKRTASILDIEGFEIDARSA